MAFNSVGFLIFFPIVLLGYFLLPQKARWVWLLAASYFFYASWNLKLLGLILFTTLVSYGAGLLMERNRKKRGGKTGVQKLLLAAALCLCLGTLFFFKYFNFFAELVGDVAAWLGRDGLDFSLRLILPVGISFYTFQTLSYVIDIYRGKISAEKHLGYYALYVSFFPQLVAGPIERPENLLPQLREHHRFTYDNLRNGGCKMLIGFFKKVAVADLLAPYVDRVFQNPEPDNGFSVAMAAVLFAVQIYCDFSGYTDIAIGASEIMGIRLMQNFDRPYRAVSVQDFWRRWHISLSSWFRDYLYFPMGGSRCSLFRTCLNILVVFAVSGLWHGAALTFVLWGLLHGIYQVAGRLTLPLRNGFWKKLGADTEGRFLTALRRVNTFALVTFAWIFFRADNLSSLGKLLSALFGPWKWDNFGFTWETLGMAVLSVAVLWALDRTLLKKSLLGKGRPSPMAAVCLIWAVALAWIYLLGQNGAGNFIYFQF